MISFLDNQGSTIVNSQILVSGSAYLAISLIFTFVFNESHDQGNTVAMVKRLNVFFISHSVLAYDIIPLKRHPSTML